MKKKQNWITMTRKPDEPLRTIYRNTEQLFRPYYVSSAVYTVISHNGDRTSDYRAETLPLSHLYISYTRDAKLTCRRIFWLGLFNSQYKSPT